MRKPILMLLIAGCVSTGIPKAILAAERNIEQDKEARQTSWAASLTVSLLPDANVYSSPFPVGIRDYRLRLARNFASGNKFTLTAGGGYSLKEIDAHPGAGLPDQLHTLFMEAGAHYRFNERSFVTLKLYPGLYSDFKEIGTDDFRMPLVLMGGYTFNSGITMVGGAAYRFGYQSGALIPIIGLSYQPNEKWRIDLLAPRPGITYTATQKIRIFAAGDFASDEYGLKDRLYGAKTIKYNDYKVMGGIQYLPATDVRLTGAAGYAFDRRFYFYDGNRPTITIDNVPFFKLSAEVFW